MIETDRFVLRPLTEADATERYWQWLQDGDARKYIAAAPSTRDLSDLRSYIAARVHRADVLFLGIFDKATGQHVGNIKYEPVDSARGFAIMGVLLGEPDYRGTGVVPEVLKATAGWLKANRGIREIVLGVAAENQAAIRAYEKVGFQLAPTPFIPAPAPGALTMVWSL